jgi:hypothetical protein
MEENQGTIEEENADLGTTGDADTGTATGDEDKGAGETDEQGEKTTDEEGQAQEKETPTITETALQRRLAREQRKHDRERQAERERFEARIKSLEEKIQPFTDPKPKLEDFDTHDAYVEALVDWKVQGGARKDSGSSNVKDTQSRPQQPDDAQFAVEDMIEAGKDKYKDWDQVVVTDAKVLPITMPMALAMAESDHGEDVAYYLGKNTSEAKRISKLSPVRQAVEIGRLSLLFDPGKRTNSQQNITRINPVGSNTKTADTPKDPNKMSYAQFKAWRASGGGR